MRNSNAQTGDLVAKVRSTAMIAAAILMSAGGSVALGQVAAPVLDLSGRTLTQYRATDVSAVQTLRPLMEQRGVDVDGSLRVPVPLGWDIAADSVGGGVAGARRLGDIDVALGAYTPTHVDLSFPSLGPPVVIGRTYNFRQSQAIGGVETPADSTGYMGRNWAMTAQPEIVLASGSTPDQDVIYVVYGADRSIELQRTASSSQTFKARNGAAGVGVLVADATNGDTFEFTDRSGTTVTFFAFNAATGSAKGQLWKTTDRAGRTTFVHSLDKATAKSTYNANAGRIVSITEGADTAAYPGAIPRVYTFTYTPVNGVQRLTRVQATASSSIIGTVDYDYYATTVAGQGLAGDLRMVTRTLPVGTQSHVTRTYMRYYTGTWSDTDGQRGVAGGLKMVVGPEGVRRYGAAGLDAATDSQLLSYSDIWMEHVSNTDRRVRRVFFNGQCGCSGGSNGTFAFSYATSSTAATDRANTVYDQAWATRTVIDQPDSLFVTMYFDEAGQPLSRVQTNADPAGSPTKVWGAGVTRNAAGQVDALFSPESLSTYSHSTGILGFASSGLVTTYGRVTTGNLAGLRTSVSVKSGVSGTPTLVSSLTLDERQLLVGASAVTVGVVASSSTYPAGTAQTTSVATTYWSSTTTSPLVLAPKSVTSTAPVVSTAKNGSGSATTSEYFMRPDGSMAFQRDAMGVIGYSGRDQYGRQTVSVQDVNTSQTGNFAGGDTASAFGISSTTGALHIVSTMTYDNQSRPTGSTTPGVLGSRTSAVTYTVLANGNMGIFAYPRIVGDSFYGPVQYREVNHAGQEELSASIALPDAGTKTPPTTTPDANWASIRTTQYDNAGSRVNSSRQYYALPPGGVLPGTLNDHYNETTRAYDDMGRVRRVQEPSGTIRTTVFDERGLAIESWIGTNDSGSNNMTLVEKREYDGNAAGGSGLLTKVTQDADGNWGTTTDQRVTTMAYDWRQRAVLTVNPGAPHRLVKYDNAGRVIAQAMYSSATGLTASSDPTSVTSGRMALSETFFDERGQNYQSKAWEVNPSTGATGDVITTNRWMNARGQEAKVAGEQISKTTYDRLGRSIGTTLIAKSTGTSYSSALAVDSGDTVLEEQWSALDANTGRTLLQYSVQRKHDDTTTAGALSSAPTSASVAVGSINGRVQVSAMYYDALDRVSDSVNLGTNAGTTFTYHATSIPARSPTEPSLRTTTNFDGHGRAWKSFDEDNRESRREYDLAGRTTKSTNNWTDGTPGGGTNNDQDQVTEYVYTLGLMVRMIEKMPSSADDIVTQYVFGTVKGEEGNAISTGHLLYKTHYPAQTSGQSLVHRTSLQSSNALGEVIRSYDPAGNRIDTTYSTAGRVVLREVHTFGSGFDTTVKSIETTYDGMGRLARARSLSSSSATLNDEVFAYDGWGNLSQTTVDADSAYDANTDTPPMVTTMTWTRNTTASGWQRLRQATVQQPGGASARYKVDGDTISEAMGRTSHIQENLTGSGAVLADYCYMGASAAVAAVLPEASIGTRLFPFGGGSADYDQFLDRFNRPIKNQWVKDYNQYNKPVFVEFLPKYDRSSLVTSVEDTKLGTGPRDDNPNLLFVRKFDQLVTRDALKRVTKHEEGQLNSGQTAIEAGKKSRQQILERDLRGRVTRNAVDRNGDGDFADSGPSSVDGGEMDDARSYFHRPSLLTRTVTDNGRTAAAVTTQYDRNGNLIADGEGYEYVYSPWCRLVEVRFSSKEVARYSYTATGRRVTERYDINQNQELDTTEPTTVIATDLAGRRVATFITKGEFYAKETFFHHPPEIRGPGFAGGPLVRDRNAALVDPDQWDQPADPDRLERRYYATDWQGRVVALVTAAGEQAESYRYTANGVPIGIPLGDVNGDGKVEVGASEEDWQQAYWWENNFGPYDARLDLNLDGSVNATDIGLVGSQSPGTMPTARASAASVGNRMFGSAMVVREAVLGREGDLRLGLAAKRAAVGCVQVDLKFPEIYPDRTLDVSECRRQLGRCPESVKRLTEAINRCKNPKCPDGITVKCVASNPDPAGVEHDGGAGLTCFVLGGIGGYNPNKPCEILLCADEFRFGDDFCTVLEHELVHAYDALCAGIDDRSCKARACAEIRAYSFVCDPLPVFFPSFLPPSGFRTFRDCVIERAYNSLPDPPCTLNDVISQFDSCAILPGTRPNWDPSRPPGAVAGRCAGSTCRKAGQR